MIIIISKVVLVIVATLIMIPILLIMWIVTKVIIKAMFSYSRFLKVIIFKYEKIE